MNAAEVKESIVKNNKGCSKWMIDEQKMVKKNNKIKINATKATKWREENSLISESEIKCRNRK